jgi:hypothetical protein
MPPYPNDELGLRRFAAYIRREAALKWTAWGLVGGLGLAVLLNAVAWAFPLLARSPRLALSAGVAALVTLLAFLVAYLYPRSQMTMARISDARMRLRARLSTALEIQAGLLPVPHEIAARQLADARAAAARADPRRAFAPRFPRRQALIAVALAALLIAGFVVPNPQEARIAQRQAEREAIAEQIERLERLRDEIAADENLSQEDKDALLRELDEAIRDLREGNLSKEEAVARLSEVEGQLQELLDEDADAREAALREAGRQAASGEHTQEIGESLSQGDYAGAARALDALSERVPDMSGEELEATAQRLEAMADALAGTNPELAQALHDAAAAMRRGDLDAAQEALARAAELTAQAGQQSAAQEVTERALGQVQEGRREIAQSGQPGQAQGQQDQGQGQQGPGQGQQGQGQGQQGQGQGQQGQGQGQQGQGQGQQSPGQSGSGSGEGDAQGQGGSGPPTDPQGPIPPNQPGQEGETPYDPIYVPDWLGGEDGEWVDVPGQGEGGPPTGETPGGPRDEGQALVPYDEVYTDYQTQAASALENSYIPQGMKEYVRAYFSALEPGR